MESQEIKSKAAKSKRWRGDGPRGHSAQGWVWLEPGVYKGNGELLIRFFFHQQDNVDQSSSEDLCYTLINHSVPRGRPSEISSEGCYENVSPKTETPRKSLGETETSYALLRVPSSPRHFSSPEEEYELVMPQRISFHPLQQPHLPLLPSETQVTYLEWNSWTSTCLTLVTKNWGFEALVEAGVRSRALQAYPFSTHTAVLTTGVSTEPGLPTTGPPRSSSIFIVQRPTTYPEHHCLGMEWPSLIPNGFGSGPLCSVAWGASWSPTAMTITKGLLLCPGSSHKMST